MFGEYRSISFWETGVRQTTIKNIKNKEKTSAKYIALPARLPNGLNDAQIDYNDTANTLCVILHAKISYVEIPHVKYREAFPLPLPSEFTSICCIYITMQARYSRWGVQCVSTPIFSRHVKIFICPPLVSYDINFRLKIIEIHITGCPDPFSGHCIRWRWAIRCWRIGTTVLPVLRTYRIKSHRKRSWNVWKRWMLQENNCRKMSTIKWVNALQSCTRFKSEIFLLRCL